MKNIKTYSIRPISIKKMRIKIGFISVILVGLFSFFGGLGNLNYLTDILQNSKISKTKLLSNAEKINFDGTTWPVKQVVDYNYKNIALAGLTYEELKEKNFSDVPFSLKTTFPTKWSSYISKYKNITLKTCWDIFTDPEELANFTFRRRTIRATWTASYDFKDIWRKNTGTHAGIDIIGNIGTPVYSIANGLVVQIKKSNKGFGNLVTVLYKKNNNKYYLGFYGHLHSIDSNIKIGKFVKKGEKLGTIGKSGNSSGSHLHFQINKVEKLEDIINGKATKGLFKTLDKLKKYTIDPIPFIEETYSFKSDNLGILDKEIKEEKVDTPDKKIVVNTLKTENKKYFSNKVEEKKQKSYIKNISISLLDNKVQLGSIFSMTLNVQPGNGKITIVPSNTNLVFKNDIIENPSKSSYNIIFTAKKEGITKLKIYDGKSEREYDIKIYKPENEKIYGLNIDIVEKLNILSNSKISIFPTDRFGKKIDLPLKGVFNVYMLKNNTKKLLKTITLDGTKSFFYIKPNLIGNVKIIVENKKFYLKKTINVDVAKDYSSNKLYANSMFNLIEKGIIKGEKGYLYPSRKLTRRELITILGRSILKTDYKKTRIEMLNYIKTKGRFFKDISGGLYSDVFIYDAWKKGIARGENKYSLANNYVSKGELLTILTRVFKVNIVKNNLSSWKDLKEGDLKDIADTTRKYALYPFKDYNYFNAGELVKREIAFETLKRFIEFKNDDFHTSADVKEANPEQGLENVMQDIFDF